MWRLIAQRLCSSMAKPRINWTIHSATRRAVNGPTHRCPGNPRSKRERQQADDRQNPEYLTEAPVSVDAKARADQARDKHEQHGHG